jgi:NAD-dependent deacetylase
LRPHVVWFGEAVPAYDEAARTLSEADILIVVGTSLQVYPAAGLIHYAENAREKYLIDPKASKINLPSDFVKISKGAVQGLNELFAQLTS